MSFNSSLDRITELKVTQILEDRKHHVTGIVLSRTDGSKVVVDLGAVRWLDQAEAWELMHPRAPATHGESYVKNGATITEGICKNHFQD